jgi:scavenger receptor class B, member 1
MISDSSPAFKYWLEPPATVYRKYYIFDVKNPLEIKEGTNKPIVVEKGPYVFREKIEKRNIKFEGKDHLTFSPVTTLFFEPSLSNGTENDRITFLNVPAVVSNLILYS